LKKKSWLFHGELTFLYLKSENHLTHRVLYMSFGRAEKIGRPWCML